LEGQIEKACQACSEPIIFGVCGCGTDDIARAIRLAEIVRAELHEIRTGLAERVRALEIVACKGD